MLMTQCFFNNGKEHINLNQTNQNVYGKQLKMHISSSKEILGHSFQLHEKRYLEKNSISFLLHSVFPDPLPSL